MKKRIGSILMTLLVIVVALGSWGVLSDFETPAPVTTFESDGLAVLTWDMAPAVGDLIVLTTLADEMVTSDVVDNSTLYVILIGTSLLTLAIILVGTVIWCRNSSRTRFFSGWVRFPKKFIQWASSPA